MHRSEHPILAGVLAGAADSLGISPVVTRATAIGLAIVLPLPVFVVYVVVALLTPRADGRMLLGSGAPRRDRLLGWAGVVATFFLVTGAATGGAPLPFAWIDPRGAAAAFALPLALAWSAGLALAGLALIIRGRST